MRAASSASAFWFCDFSLEFSFWPKAKSCFSVCKRKPNIHIIRKYTNTLQPLRLKDCLSAHAGVIKNNTAPVTCQFYYSRRSCTSVQRYRCFIRSQPQIHCASSHFQTAPVDENELHLLRLSHPVPLSPGPAQRSCHPSCAGEHKPGAALAAALAPWRWSKKYADISNKLGKNVPRVCVCMCVWEAVPVFILLYWVYPSAPSLRCPWYAAERIVWKLSLSRGEALEGLQTSSSQVGQLGSNKTHIAIFSIWTRFLVRTCTSFSTRRHFILHITATNIRVAHHDCKNYSVILPPLVPFWYHRHVSHHAISSQMKHSPSSPFPLLAGWVFHSQS